MIGWSQTDTCEWTQFFHANGVVSSEGCFVQGIPAGVWVSYSDEGIKLSEGQRFNNQPHGEWKFYSDGELRELAVFREGQREGVQVLWEDGMKTDSLTWVNNQIQGLAYSFYEDGSTLSEVPYLNGKKRERLFYIMLQEFQMDFDGTRMTTLSPRRISIVLTKKVEKQVCGRHFTSLDELLSLEPTSQD